ncbi:UNKNOWN [Stylonychia lemnae]|uniref:Uncharacterized protein n=1 Tax=Stylonychia lemnae TaxID=5949 RepID=A0A078AER4_STYLE|nr:UNKNOWN [Stylonychia lemnae]|eukprot:CDW80720.1 UNKNOWN [Stylonychia lemnae]
MDLCGSCTNRRSCSGQHHINAQCPQESAFARHVRTCQDDKFMIDKTHIITNPVLLRNKRMSQILKLQFKIGIELRICKFRIIK